MNPLYLAAKYCAGIINCRIGEDRNPNTSRGLIIVGGQGTGKTNLLRAINRIVGQEPPLILHAWDKKQFVALIPRRDFIMYDGLPRITLQMGLVLKEMLETGAVTYEVPDADEVQNINASKTHVLFTMLFLHLTPDILDHFDIIKLDSPLVAVGHSAVDEIESTIREYMFEAYGLEVLNRNTEIIELPQDVAPNHFVVETTPEPKMIENPDLTALRAQCLAHHQEVVSGKYHDDDDADHYIYEAAMETFFGKGYWDWFNKTVE